MGWTIVQPNPEHIKARKEVHHGIESSNFAFAQVNTAVKQPLQDEDLLTLPKLFSFLQEVERDSDNAFLMRGQPVNQNTDLSYGLTESNWLDCSSKQFQLDLDNETDLLNQDSPLDDRVAVAMEELPFLKNCRFIAQLSSSAGLGIVYKKNGEEKDCSKKYCLRLWVETDKAYSCLELHHHLADFSSIIDLSMYEPTRRHYIMRGHFSGTENLLKNEPHLKYYEGAALSLDEIPGEIKEAARKKTKRSSKKEGKANKKLSPELSKFMHTTNRESWMPELEKLAEKGALKGQRNPLFTKMFLQEAFFNSGNSALLIDEFINSNFVRGDRPNSDFYSWGKSSGKHALDVLRLSNAKFRQDNFASIENFHEINLAERDWSDVLDYRAVAVRSCMGTNKTKGVIYDLVKHAKSTNKSVLIVTPFTAVTLQIAEAVGIQHYHSWGEHKTQKERLFGEVKHLAVCYQSLGIYNDMGLIPKFDIVIIDEASQVFRDWAGQDSHVEEMNMLFNIMDRSKNTLIFDADIDDDLCLWGLSRIANFSRENAALYYNSASYLQGYEITISDNYGRTLESLVDSIKAGKKVAIFTDYSDDKGTISAFMTWLEKQCSGKKGKAFDRETVRVHAPELRSHPNKTISDWMKNDELDFLVVSPWCACGWDYLEKGYDFDEAFVISTAGFFSAQKIKQMLRRMRMTRKAHVYMTNRSQAAFPNTTFDAIRSEKGVVESEMSTINAWKVRSKQAHDIDMANPRWLLLELLKEGGAIVSMDDSNEI